MSKQRSSPTHTSAHTHTLPTHTKPDRAGGGKGLHPLTHRQAVEENPQTDATAHPIGTNMYPRLDDTDAGDRLPCCSLIN